MIRSRLLMVSGAAAQISPQFDPRANSVIVCSTSLVSRPPSGVNSTPNEGATDWMAANWPTFEGTVGSRTTPIRAMRGAISLSSSSHFVDAILENWKSSHVATWLRHAGNKPGGHRICHHHKYNRQGAGRLLQRDDRRSGGRKDEVEG